jgi:hypothetical protein
MKTPLRRGFSLEERSPRKPICIAAGACGGTGWDDYGVNFADRAARNEEIFRDVNERIEQGAEQHGVEAPLSFHCECGRASCVTTIDIAPAEYERVVHERYRFILIPGHEQPEIERIVERRGEYVVVEKVGEARERIDRDHPQQRHR